MSATGTKSGSSSATTGTGKLNRWLVALLVLQAAILAIGSLGSDEPVREKPKKIFADLDTSKVTAIRIEDANKKVTELNKTAGKWVVASGGGYPTKKDKVSDLLGKLTAVMAGGPVTTDPTHQRELEVASDKFQRDVTLTLEGGKKIRFFLGSSPGLKRVHLRLEGKKDVLVASELSTWDVGTGAYDWVETEYLKLERDEVVTLTVKNASGEIVLSKKDGSWQLAGLPPKTKLKQSAVDSLLGSVSSINLQDPVGRQIKPEHGLSQPKALAMIVTEKVIKKEAKDAASQPASQPAASQPVEQRERKTYTLRIGAKHEDDAYYAKASTSDFVVTIGAFVGDELVGKKVADLTEKESDGKDDEKDGKDDRGDE